MPRDDTTPADSTHVSIWIAVPAATVYAYATAHLTRWAGGLSSPALGEVTVEFVAPNDHGILDHTVRLPDGQQFYNPMRVIPDGADPGRCEVVFTVRRWPGTTDGQFAADAATVASDLRRLRELATGQAL